MVAGSDDVGTADEATVPDEVDVLRRLYYDDHLDEHGNIKSSAFAVSKGTMEISVHRLDMTTQEQVFAAGLADQKEKKEFRGVTRGNVGRIRRDVFVNGNHVAVDVRHSPLESDASHCDMVVPADTRGIRRQLQTIFSPLIRRPEVEPASEDGRTENA